MTPSVLKPELVATRNHPWAVCLTFQGEGMQEASFRAQVRAYPGAPGAALINLAAVTDDTITGIVDVATKGSGATVERTIEVTVTRADIDALPRLGPRGDDQLFAWEMDVAFDDTTWEPWLTSPFRLREGVVRG